MEDKLFSLLFSVRTGKEIPSFLNKEIEKECNRIRKKLFQKIFDKPKIVKCAARDILDNLTVNMDYLHQDSIALSSEVKNGMDNHRNEYINTQLSYFSEIDNTCSDLQIILLEILIKYFPDEYDTEHYRNVLKKISPFHPLLKKSTIEPFKQADDMKQAEFLIKDDLYNDINESEDAFFNRISKHNDSIANPAEKYQYLKLEKRKYLDKLDLATLEASGSILSSLTSKQRLFLDRRIQNLIDDIKDDIPSEAKKIIDDYASQKSNQLKYQGLKIPPEINTKQHPLKQKGISLIHYYEGKPITRENGVGVAQENGYYSKNSGDKLYQLYIYYSVRSNRISFDNENSKNIMKNKVLLFESVIEYLKPEYKSKATDELKTLRANYENLLN
jgi:3-methyladenine DNA glycosylase AlkC